MSGSRRPSPPLPECGQEPGLGYERTRRLLDLAGGCVGLLLLGVLFVPIALAILLEDGPPVVFAQTRVGKGERLFRIFKLRTIAHDGRITRVGRWLRRSALDELPQFWNVLRGEMSLVGPRPELPELYAAYQPWQRRRVEVLPGLTGWWQVNGRSQPMIDHVRYDIEYLERRSLLWDLYILLLTGPSLLQGPESPPPQAAPAAERRHLAAG